MARLEPPLNLGNLKHSFFIRFSNLVAREKNACRWKRLLQDEKKEILKYLKHETLATNKGKARKIRTQATMYT